MAPVRRTTEATEALRASLIEVAQRIVARDGASALTMRALAAEAGCAVGLPYKVFANREELVAELISVEFVRLREAFDRLVAQAGTRTIGHNLGRYADLLLGSPSIALAREVAHDEELSRAINAKAGETGVVASVVSTVVDYLAAEKHLGRVDPDVDEHAFGFLVAGAVHNLLVSGEPYPRPTARRLKRMLAAVATRLAPTKQLEESHADDP
jgi:AcrR family transcriptional regulator